LCRCMMVRKAAPSLCRANWTSCTSPSTFESATRVAFGSGIAHLRRVRIDMPGTRKGSPQIGSDGNIFADRASIGRWADRLARLTVKLPPPEIPMSAEQSSPTGPDLVQGISIDALADGQMLLGHVGQEGVLLARRGNEIFAIGATCSHYGGPLAEGLLVDDTVRCPWHHACFSLRSGEALHAPALSPVARWQVEQRDGKVFVREKQEAKESRGKSR